MIQAPCKGCEQRHEGCHGKCKAYKDYVAQNEAQKEMIRKGKQENSARTVYMSDRMFRNALHNHSENRVFRQHMK